MKPRLEISFSLKNQYTYWFGNEYVPKNGEYLLNHARSGLVLALDVANLKGKRVGVMAYNCHTVFQAVKQAGCEIVFLDVTDELRLNISSLKNQHLSGIVISNLFGIRNDVETIRKECPGIVIIVDNAHGFGLPIEGDFAVYSVGLGKFPSIGDGGILYTNLPIINQRHYSFLEKVVLFVKLQVHALAYSRLLYWITRRIKLYSYNHANPNLLKFVPIVQMASGISRIYRQRDQSKEALLASRRSNAAEWMKALSAQDNIVRIWSGDNAFMLIIECRDVEIQKEKFEQMGVETETHFARCLEWAHEFGYEQGQCPQTELLVKKLLMIPTYYAL